MPSGNGRSLVHLSRLLPRMGKVAKGQEPGAASNGEETLRPRAGGGYGLVPEEPTHVHPRPALPSDREDAGPLCLLRHIGELPTTALVRLSGREDLAEMAVAAGSPASVPLGPLPRTPKATSSAGSQDCPSLHLRERSSPVKNRMLEIGTSGSVRGRGGNIPTYSAREESDRGSSPRRQLRLSGIRCAAETQRKEASMN